jgi:hypothetical protein
MLWRSNLLRIPQKTIRRQVKSIVIPAITVEVKDGIIIVQRKKGGQLTQEFSRTPLLQ